MSTIPLLLKTPAEYSSGLAKLPLGKVDPRLLRIIVNSGKGIVLHDGTWSKTAANPNQGLTIDLDIRSNAVTDKSGSGNHPTLSNVTLLNGEMQFGGVNSVAIITTSATFKTTSFSIFVRVRPNTGLGLVYPRLYDFSGASGGALLFVDAANGSLNARIYAADGSYYEKTTAINTLVAGETADIIVTYETYQGSGLGRTSIYKNGLLLNQGESNKVYAPSTVPLRIGDTGGGGRALNASIYAFRMYNYALSPAEVLALTDKRTALYPSQDSLAFAETQTSVKDLQWFVRNPTSIIEVNPLVLADESASSLSRDQSGADTGSVARDLVGTFISSEKVAVGTYSITTSLEAGTYRAAGMSYVFPSDTNISAYDILSFRLWGENDGAIFEASLYDTAFAFTVTKIITDDWTGWKTFHLLLRKDFTDYGYGTLNLATIRGIRCVLCRSQREIYVDRVILDVCPSIPVKKLELSGLYLENQLEESPDPIDVLEIADDWQAAFWNPATNITLSNETTIKLNGIDSLKVVFAGVQYAGISHSYGGNQNWSAYNFVSFKIYGSNSGQVWTVKIDAPDTNNRYAKTFTNNFTGWKRFVFPIKAMGTSGTPVLSTVTKISIYMETASPFAETIYLDRMVLQKGRWAFVEVAVPDTLYNYQNNLGFSANQISWLYWQLWAWDASAYLRPFIYDANATAGKIYPYGPNLKFLNTTTARQCYETDDYVAINSATFFVLGSKGQTKTRSNTSNQADKSITYNGVGGCRWRIGFAIKMPPYDGLTSSTDGINQAKLKLEVFVP